MSELAVTPVLSVRDLNVFYRVGEGDVHAVKGADIDLLPGDRLAIVGESGSGKSSLSLAVAGFLTEPNARITAESFVFDGQQIDRSEIHRLPRRTPGLSMVFQDAMTSLDPVWSVGSQLLDVLKAEARRSGRRLSKKGALAEAEQWLAQVGLPDFERVMSARPFEISGGMRQRVMMAIALCGRPRLLIADEPTSALDAALSREMMELMVDLTEKSGAALIIVTHDIGLCLDYAHRVLVMNRGEVVDDVDAKNIEKTATHSYTVGLLECIPTLGNVDAYELPTLEGADRQWALSHERMAS